MTQTFPFNSRKPAARLEGLPFRKSPYVTVCVAICLAMSSISIELGGQLFLSEILFLIIATLLVFIDWRGVRQLPGAWLWIGAVTMGLIAYLVADVVNGSDMLSLIKGAARWVVFGATSLVLSYAIGLYRRGPEVVVLGVTTAGMWDAIQVYGEQGWAWKFAWGEPITTLIILGSGYLPKWFAAFVCFIAGTLNFYFDYRSMAGACLVCCAFHCIRGGTVTASRLFVVCVSVILIMGGCFIYRSTILADATHASRSEDSNEIRFTGIVFGWQAIKASPWVGHGTWATNSELLATYVEMRQDARLLRGARITGEESENAAIVGAIHSQILQGGAEAGVLGLLTFLLIAYVLLRSLLLGFFRSCLMDGREIVSVFFLTLAVWSVFGSPFAGVNRLLMAMGIASAVRFLVVIKMRSLTVKKYA